MIVSRINDAMRWVVFWRWMWIVSWLYVTGRLYVFRNVPTWVIEQVIVSNAKSKRPLTSGDALYFLKQANDELRLRRTRT